MAVRTSSSETPSCPSSSPGRDWARQREGWAAFFSSSAGYPAGYGGATYYHAPGKRGKLVRIAWSDLGGHHGKELRGSDEIVPLAKPCPVARTRSAVVVVAEIWRRGERQGPKGGSLVGLRYQLGPTLLMDAQREDAAVHRSRGRGEVLLEPGEHAFLAALAEVRRRSGKGR